jgi:SAM-dependent methyltransferase
MSSEPTTAATSSEHMSRKRDAYWADLVGGLTAGYKTAQVLGLLEGRAAPADSVLVDVGAGTSDLSTLIGNRVGTARILCVDYDDGVVAAQRAAETNPDVEWRVADARELRDLGERIGLVSFFDMLHEVYSFAGRGEGDPIIDHARGIASVHDVLRASAAALEPGGMIVITDDLLPESDGTTRVRCQSDEIAEVVRRVEREYPSRTLRITWSGDRDFEINDRDFATLLTQYDKVKRGDFTRWNVEQLEVHQYMSVTDYQRELGAAGMTVHVDVGTPEAVGDEWAQDFSLLAGLDDFPRKRVAVVAVKDR